MLVHQRLNLFTISMSLPKPTGSMYLYGVLTYLWLIDMLHVGKDDLGRLIVPFFQVSNEKGQATLVVSWVYWSGMKVTTIRV